MLSGRKIAAAIEPAIRGFVERKIAAAVAPLLVQIKELQDRPKGLLYEGSWSEGSTYEKDSAVTYSGSLFVALRRTSAKPEGSPDWRLAVKRGRDGRDAAKGGPFA